MPDDPSYKGPLYTPPPSLGELLCLGIFLSVLALVVWAVVHNTGKPDPLHDWCRAHGYATVRLPNATLCADRRTRQVYAPPSPAYDYAE